MPDLPWWFYTGTATIETKSPNTDQAGGYYRGSGARRRCRREYRFDPGIVNPFMV